MIYQELEKKYGTPFYLLDIDKLRKRIDYLRKYINNDIKLIYAVKANTFLIPDIKNLVDKVELCSPGELEIAIDSKVTYEDMVISGVYKDEMTMRSLFETTLPGKFTIESVNQWLLLSNLSQEYNKKINVLLRLTSGSQFGMSKEDISYIIENNNNELINILGIQYFSKTQRHAIKILEKELISINNYMQELESNYNIKLEEFEYGPGFPVFYFEGDCFDEDKFLTEFSSIINNIENKKVSLELGRSVAAITGEYVTKIVDRKDNHTGKYAIVDGGMHHLVYYGQSMAMKVPFHEIVPDKKGDDTYIICGSLCTINDILVKEFKARDLSVGDLIVFKNTGAYALTEGISLFLSRDLPKVIIKNKDDIKLVRDSIKTSEINNPCSRER